MLVGILLTVIILVALALTGVVLLQRSEGGALGMGGGPTGFMTARGAGDLLTRTTWILGGLFFFLCLALTIASGRTSSSSSVVDRLKIDAVDPNSLKAPPPAAPVTAPAPAGLPGQIGAPAPQISGLPTLPPTSAPAPTALPAQPAPALAQ